MTYCLAAIGLFLIVLALTSRLMRGGLAHNPVLACALGGFLCALVLPGAMVAAAESGRMIARYLGLAATFLGAFVLVGGFFLLEHLAGAPSGEEE